MVAIFPALILNNTSSTLMKSDRMYKVYFRTATAIFKFLKATINRGINLKKILRLNRANITST